MASGDAEGSAASSAAAQGLWPINVLSLAARWRSETDWQREVEEMESEPDPSCLNTINSSGLFQIVSQDKMSVKYFANQMHGHDVGVVQADCPAPTSRPVYYFEMTVTNAGLRGCTSIGFTSENFKMRRQPGWEPNSCGYHGDDGFLYLGQGKGDSYGPTFTTGDTVGAGINYASQEFFFTKNGVLLRSFPKEIRGPLFPSVAVHSQNEELTVNFGRKPFRFNLEAMIAEQRRKQQAIIDKLPLQPDLSHWIVRSYLLHYGYQDTLTALDASGDSSPMNSKGNGLSEEPATYAISNRKVLRQLIMDGNINDTFQKLQELYPQVVQDEASVICFLLHSQRFIEYIHAGHLEDALNFARTELAKYLDKYKIFEHMAMETLALLSYENPKVSCLAYLLESTQREFVADAVNAAVLSTNPDLKSPEDCLASCLEKLLMQLTVSDSVRQKLNDCQGETFFLHREVQRA